VRYAPLLQGVAHAIKWPTPARSVHSDIALAIAHPIHLVGMGYQNVPDLITAKTQRRSMYSSVKVKLWNVRSIPIC
jgi:hypothetical protein